MPIKKSSANAAWAAIAALSLAYFLYAAYQVGEFTRFDDAYMFTRYARHFLDGDGFSWNLGEGAAFGITSPAHLFLVTATLGLTGWPDFVVLTRVSMAAMLAAMAATVWLGFLIQPRRAGGRSWAPLAAIPYLVFLTSADLHSQSGMDTALSLLANTLFACAVVISARRRSAATLARCLAAGYFSFAARPDNGIYVALLPPLYFLATGRKSWSYALRYLLLLATVLAGDALLKLSLFGDILPLAYHAKKNGFYEGYTGAAKWNPMITFLMFWIMAAPLIALTVVKAKRSRFAEILAVAIPFAATMAYYATVVQIMGFHARYYFPSLAFVFLMAGLALWPPEPAAGAEEAPESAAAAAGKAGSQKKLLMRLAVALLILLPLPSESLKEWAVGWWRDHLLPSSVPIRGSVQYTEPAGGSLPPLRGSLGNQLMAVLLGHLPPGSVIAASEYGYVGSRLPQLTIIDLVGLHDRTLAHHGFSADYVLGRQPDMIWLPHEDYSGLLAELLDHREFQQDYELYPGAFSHGIALRKSSPRFAEVKKALRNGFIAVYPDRKLEDQISLPIGSAPAAAGP